MTEATQAKFALAEKLGVFVSDIEDRMSLAEFCGWIRYYNNSDATPTTDDQTTDDELLRVFGIASY